MPRKEQLPTEKIDDSKISDKVYEHPAFGIVVVTHWTGGGKGQRLFGSELSHNGGMCLTFSEASQHRGLSYDRIHPGKIILEVDISESQWARIVASTGKGCGTPVTIRHRRTGPLEDVPAIAAPECSKREVHGQEMATAMRQAMERVRNAKEKFHELLEKPGSVSKTELKAIYSLLAQPIEQLPGTVQFIYDMFSEATEAVAEDAKLEIEAHVDNIATELGIQQLRELAPRFSEQQENRLTDNENSL